MKLALQVIVLALATACSRQTKISADDAEAATALPKAATPNARPRCDIVLMPWTGPRKLDLGGRKRLCIGDMSLEGEPEDLLERGKKAGCRYSAPSGAYFLACDGFRLAGGGPITNFGWIEIYAPPDAANDAP